MPTRLECGSIGFHDMMSVGLSELVRGQWIDGWHERRESGKAPSHHKSMELLLGNSAGTNGCLGAGAMAQLANS